MTNPHPPGLRPPMGPHDVYLYAHGSAAISLLHGGDTWRGSVTLAEARQAVVAANEAGALAWVAGDDAPLAIDTLIALGGPGIHLEPYQPLGPPQEWRHGRRLEVDGPDDGSIDRGVPTPSIVRELSRGQRFFERVYVLLVAIAVLSGIALAFVEWPLGPGVAIVILALGFFLGPGTIEILRGRPACRLDGTDLWVRHVLGRRRRIDLTRVTGAEVTAPRLPLDEVPAEATTLHHLLLAHPDGWTLGRRSRSRLRLDDAAHRDLAGGLGRVIIVPVPVRHMDEVIPPVADVLIAGGIRLGPGYRRTLRRRG